MRAKHLAAVAGAALLAAGASAAPSVEVVNVQQQYPWTNTVDITYNVQGIKDFPARTATGAYASNETYFVTFTATDTNGVAIADVSGATVFTNALVNGSVVEVAQWNPKLGLQLTDCKLTPSVFRGEDDAYLVINLETNATGRFDHWFEPMSTQTASNKRYNTDEYKTKKLVMRRIPAGTYWIGENGVAGEFGKNSRHSVPMDKDYYMGVFELTQGQYQRIMGAATGLDNTIPKVISYNEARGNARYGSDITDGNGFCGILNEKAALHGFDLPTASMWEVAARAGLDTPWITGATSAGMADYAWYNPISGLTKHSVGLKRANNWGLYDVMGNVFEITRDAGLKNTRDLKDAAPNGQKSITESDSGYYTNTRIECGMGYDWGVGSRTWAYRFAYFTRNTLNATQPMHGMRLSYIPGGTSDGKE